MTNKGLSLTEQGRLESFIGQKNQRKCLQRITRTKRVMAKFGNRYPCSACFHNKTDNCTIAPLPNGCEDWFDPNLPDNKQGLNWNKPNRRKRPSRKKPKKRRPVRQPIYKLVK